MNRWVVLTHHLPPKPDYLRVKVWRRLQRVGAVQIKSSVYVLPSSDSSIEDFHWLLREIEQEGGDGAIFEASFLHGLSDADVESLFRDARAADWKELAADARKSGDAASLAKVRRRFGELAAIDFFSAPGRAEVEQLLDRMEARVMANEKPAPKAAFDAKSVRGSTWVTRKGVKVDRMASAWLIRRFIDPKAKFRFVVEKGFRPKSGELRFDMFDAEFTHEGEECTFEVLKRHFRVDDSAVREIAEIVHDLDLKDGKFERDDAAGVGLLLAGIASAHEKDEERLARSAATLDDLYAHFKSKKKT